MIPTGIIRIESNSLGQPMGRVVRQFGEIDLDQSVIQLESIPASIGRPVAVAQGPAEKVIYIANDPVLPSLQNYVLLSAKSANGVRVGDQFTLIDDSVDPKHPAPPVPAALAEVVRVTPYAVTAIVVDHDHRTDDAGRDRHQPAEGRSATTRGEERPRRHHRSGREDSRRRNSVELL